MMREAAVQDADEAVAEGPEGGDIPPAVTGTSPTDRGTI